MQFHWAITVLPSQAQTEYNAVPTLSFSACNKDNGAFHRFERAAARKNSEEKPMNKRRKNIPKNIYIITNDESKSKEAVAKAMADMYKRMLNPV